MTEKRFLITAPVEEVVIELLEAHAPTVTSPSTDQETLSGLLSGTVGIVARGEARITPELVEAAPDLKVVGRTGVGYDNVDVPALTRRSIPLIIAPVGGFSVAEGALGMLLCLIKNMRAMDTAVREGNWDIRYDALVGDVAGHTVGIAGMGRIGSYLARLLQPFEVAVLGYDPYVDAERMAEIGVRKVELKALLAESDYVSLHMLLNDETRGMIDRDAVAGMKRGAVFLNLARGGITDGLDTLADALDDGQLSYVGLDVFPTEPPDVSHRIFKHPRCIFAPHSLGMSELAMDRVGRSMANDMLAVLEGKRPQHCVNPEVFE